MHLDKMDKTLAKIYSTEDISAAAALILPPLQVGIMWFMVLYGLVRFLNMNFNAAFARGTSYDYDDYGDYAAAAATADKRQDKFESMFDPGLVNVVEMSYWVVKFVDHYHKLYQVLDENQKELNSGKKKWFFGNTASTLVQFSRFFLKYINSYEKLWKTMKKV